ncbi:hypothetical protein Enr13x_11640 [Stieleria neptunia]|uniref:Uncharacterized protein n=1 Tax=Stieleria neptunia TaxID=2527979 RepID=A0A518HKF4_9BACT|nr:hypothetical protein Enr13x_11640 [Stieleria neptunia]
MFAGGAGEDGKQDAYPTSTSRQPTRPHHSAPNHSAIATRSPAPPQFVAQTVPQRLPEGHPQHSLGSGSERSGATATPGKESQILALRLSIGGGSAAADRKAEDFLNQPDGLLDARSTESCFCNSNASLAFGSKVNTIRTSRIASSSCRDSNNRCANRIRQTTLVGS